MTVVHITVQDNVHADIAKYIASRFKRWYKYEVVTKDGFSARTGELIERCAVVRFSGRQFCLEISSKTIYLCFKPGYVMQIIDLAEPGSIEKAIKFTRKHLGIK